ncbi:ulp1 protease family protein [Colletotrichum tofieldiae]|nr:Ulp1 protease family protein [Colletotrichum tofieldiae]GKT82034.1 ulp1 protease family protein [Colletotrichum tofieldiae]
MPRATASPDAGVNSLDEAIRNFHDQCLENRNLLPESLARLESRFAALIDPLDLRRRLSSLARQAVVASLEDPSASIASDKLPKLKKACKAWRITPAAAIFHLRIGSKDQGRPFYTSLKTLSHVLPDWNITLDELCDVANHRRANPDPSHASRAVCGEQGFVTSDLDAVIRRHSNCDDELAPAMPPPSKNPQDSPTEGDEALGTPQLEGSTPLTPEAPRKKDDEWWSSSSARYSVKALSLGFDGKQQSPGQSIDTAGSLTGVQDGQIGGVTTDCIVDDDDDYDDNVGGFQMDVCLDSDKDGDSDDSQLHPMRERFADIVADNASDNDEPSKSGHSNNDHSPGPRPMDTGKINQAEARPRSAEHAISGPALLPTGKGRVTTRQTPGHVFPHSPGSKRAAPASALLLSTGPSKRQRLDDNNGQDDKGSCKKYTGSKDTDNEAGDDKNMGNKDMDNHNAKKAADDEAGNQVDAVALLDTDAWMRATWLNDALDLVVRCVEDVSYVDSGELVGMGDDAYRLKKATASKFTSNRTILLPLYLPSHWVMASIQLDGVTNSLESIKIADSLPSDDHEAAAEALVGQLVRRYLPDLEGSYETRMSHVATMAQHNGSDCGVFAFVAALSFVLAQDRPRALHSQLWRYVIALFLTNGDPKTVMTHAEDNLFPDVDSGESYDRGFPTLEPRQGGHSLSMVRDVMKQYETWRSETRATLLPTARRTRAAYMGLARSITVSLSLFEPLLQQAAGRIITYSQQISRVDLEQRRVKLTIPEGGAGGGAAGFTRKHLEANLNKTRESADRVGRVVLMLHRLSEKVKMAIPDLDASIMVFTRAHEA